MRMDNDRRIRTFWVTIVACISGTWVGSKLGISGSLWSNCPTNSCLLNYLPVIKRGNPKSIICRSFLPFKPPLSSGKISSHVWWHQRVPFCIISSTSAVTLENSDITSGWKSWSHPGRYWPSWWPGFLEDFGVRHLWILLVFLNHRQQNLYISI